MLHKLVFRSTTKKHKPVANKKEKKRNYKALEGKIIRNIIIETKDPFGFSFTDKTQRANSWLEKTGNQIHIKSKNFAIRNFLLLKENTPLDTLLLNESERLLRAQNYIREVTIMAESIEKGSDSVDVTIVALDSWSLIPKGSFSGSKNKVTLKERNFIGLGHQFVFSYANRLSDGKNAYDAEYKIPNFKNTFISSSLRYSINLDGFYIKSIDFEREFYSPFSRWAGGIYLDEQYRTETLQIRALEYVDQNFKYMTQDYWGGHSIKLFKGNTEEQRSTNLISSVRFFHADYKERPSFEYDSINFFSNETFYLASIGVASRQFIEDSYIFKDGITEDVPVGTVYALTGGLQRKNQQGRFYLGVRASHGNYFSWGYLSTNFEVGSFFKNSKTEQTTYSVQANYFTNLISLDDKWRMRQFVKPQFIVGINRLNSLGDRLTINQSNRFTGSYGKDDRRSDGSGIPGFTSNLVGTQKYVLSLQTQFYSPWEVLGFRMNPYINYTGAMLGDESHNIGKSKLYSSFGIGFIIRNDYLVFSSFQLSLSFFPQIPGQGYDVFKTNSFETEDFGFQNFQLGKPRTVLYN